MKKGIEDRGFKKSNHDDCLFMNGSVIVLFWVDDCIFHAKDKKLIDETFASLKTGFLLEKEEDMAGFLGIDVHKDKTSKSIGLTQTRLIYRILTVTNMEICTLKYTLAENQPLCHEISGEPCYK